jgi:hypothetical protein
MIDRWVIEAARQRVWRKGDFVETRPGFLSLIVEVGLGDGAPPARPASGRNPVCLSKRMRSSI